MHHTLKETLATRDSKKELQQRDIGHVMCYQCKITGQYANDCPEKKDEAKLTIHPYTSKATTKCCYSCEEEGHYSRDCPIKRTRSVAFAIEYDRKDIEALLALEESKKKRKLGSNQHHSEPKRDTSQVLCNDKMRNDLARSLLSQDENFNGGENPYKDLINFSY